MYDFKDQNPLRIAVITAQKNDQKRHQKGSKGTPKLRPDQKCQPCQHTYNLDLSPCAGDDPGLG